MKEQESMSFEKALKKLEEIVEHLEKGDTSLEESLKYYQEGVILANFCTKQLEKAEKQVLVLQEENNGEFKTDLFLEKESSY
ncbi:MAG: exodeoxyribonuclease VII small subunit [Epulopiscium sp.]|nr:exodeoxyribonuclease VII small subunit [Candidatus Epulonipiscium sp.]